MNVIYPSASQNTQKIMNQPRFGDLPKKALSILESDNFSTEAADEHLVDSIKKATVEYVRTLKGAGSASGASISVWESALYDATTRLADLIDRIPDLTVMKEVVEFLKNSHSFQRMIAIPQYDYLVATLVQKASELHNPFRGTGLGE